MERFTKDIEGRNGAEKDGSIAATGYILSGLTELVAKRGELWRRSSIQKCNVPQNLIVESLNSAVLSTWTANLFDFAHFAQAWMEENRGDFPDDFVEWCNT